MMWKIWIGFLALAMVLPASYVSTNSTAENYIVRSPNGKISVRFSLKNGCPRYSMAYNHLVIIDVSSMGFEFKGMEPLRENLKIIDAERRSEDKAWEPVWGEKDRVRDHYNEFVVHLKEDKKPYRSVDLTFRAYDEGAAFRYTLPEQENLGDFIITGERTQFQFSDNYRAWWQPGSYDSYYEETHQETFLGDVDSRVNMPMTVEINDNLYVCVTEANLTDYADMLLALTDKAYTFESDLVPLPDGTKVRARTPHSTPWRVIIMGEKPGDLIENNDIILNLNAPCALKDTSWINPGKLVGIWWGYHTGRYSPWAATTARSKEFIDFASRHGIHKLLIEGWTAQGWSNWDRQNFTTPSEYLDLPEVLNYGHQHDVELLMWMETGGNVTNLLNQLDEALQLYEDWGAFGIMVGWAGSTAPHNHHDQYMVNLYHEILRKAAKHHLTVIIHESYKPTGLRRTYPNWMTREGVQGMEQSAWSQVNTAQNMVTLPFTRMVAGPMNYTPGVFDPTIPEREGNRVESTVAKQLAMYVVYFDPQQRIVGFPKNCEAAPSFEFLEHVPTVWDETRVLNGVIGDHITMARRSGDDWYIGSMTDEDVRVIDLPMDFLGPGKFVAHIYSDGPDAHYLENPKPVDINRVIVYSSDMITASLAPGGGQAMRITPASEEKAKNLPAYEPPKYEISNLEIPTKVKANEPFTVEATVKNSGSLVGGKEIWIYIDGEPNASKLVRVGAGESVRAGFIVSLYMPGTHEITIENLPPKTVIVDPRSPTFEYSDLEIKSSASVGEKIQITATIKNIGSCEGAEKVKLYINGELVDSKPVTVPSAPGGFTKEVKFTHIFAETGIYQITIGDLSKKVAVPTIDLAGKWLFHRGDEKEWKNPEFDDSAWDIVWLPASWEEHSDHTADDVFGWYRRRIKIPGSWEGYALKLTLGKIDDVDASYFNGEKIGEMGKFPEMTKGHIGMESAWSEVREYIVPSELINYGEENLIAIRVFDGDGGGGLYSGPITPVEVVTEAR